MAVSVILIATLSAMSWPTPSEASKNFLADDSSQHLNSRAFKEEIENAMGSMLGCGGQASGAKINKITKVLQPMWKTMPKIAHGRIDRRSLRYLVHRYFMKTSSLMIRGFEPTRPVNDSYWGVADILSQVVPAYVESVLESKGAKQRGFAFNDTLSMVVMLDQLVMDSESTLLQKVYEDQHKPTQRALSQHGLKQVLEAYLVNWMVDGDAEDIAILLDNRTLLNDVVPHWGALVDFADGRINSLQYARHQEVPRGHERNTWLNKYSFEDAHEIVGGITTSFQSYWQSECDTMKNALVSMDEQNTGRVPLSKFYNTTINTDWRFGESEAYLRELGALDESSSWMGPQVIIPNYIQSTSNCIVSTPHYLVCCMNECEALLGEIEEAIGAPTASPADIFETVGNMTSQTTLDDDDSPVFAADDKLTLQLQEVANSHGGKVPLHGRLFAQWLHYVFPRECPFPHKIGMVSSVTPSQYGEDYVATEKDMKKHASNTSSSILPSLSKNELQWMSQWSSDEELIVDYSSELSMPWQQRLLLACGGLLFLGLGGWGGFIHWSKQSAGMSSMNGRVAWI